LIGDRGSGWEGDVIPGLIDDKRAFKPHILQELLVQEGADVLIEEIFRYTSRTGGSRTIDGMAYIDGNDKILCPTITAYCGHKNQKRETGHYQVIKHLR
jgi:hypothetical protein